MTQGTVDTPLATHIQLCCQERQSQSLAVCMPAWAQHSHEQLFRQAVAFVSLADFMNSMKAGTETLALLSAADEIFQILVKRSDEINQAAMGVCVDELVHMVCVVPVSISTSLCVHHCQHNRLVVNTQRRVWLSLLCITVLEHRLLQTLL